MDPAPLEVDFEPRRDSYVSPLSYWSPRHFVRSAWMEHAPFGFWIIGAARPTRVVELGTHTGFSFFVFCEAVARLGIACELFALDTWRGDDQAGHYGEEVYRDVQSTADRDYPSTANLVRGLFSESVERFADGTIDLLHVDGRHGYSDVREDFETYLPKLSDRAVVLFHDIAEYQEGFGVHRYWDEITERFPAYSFGHGHGLGVAAIGEKAPTSVMDFIEEGRRDPAVIRAFYSGLGKQVAEQYEEREQNRFALEALESRVDEYRDASNRSDRRVAESDERSRLLEQEISALRTSTSWRVTAPIRAIGSVLRR